MSGVYLKLYIDPIKAGLIAKMGAAQFETLVAIASFMNENGECYPTQEQLAELLGIQRKAVNKRINNLLEFHLEDGSPVIIREKKQVTRGKGNAMCKYSCYKVLPTSGLTIFKSNNVPSKTPCNSNNVPLTSSNNVPSTSTNNVPQTTHKQEPLKQEPIKQEPINNTKDVVGYFCKKYREAYNVNYNPNWKRDMSQAKKLLSAYDGETVKKILDTVFTEYDARWKNDKFPRPSLGALVSWLANEALAVADESTKKKAEQLKAIEEAQKDPRLSDEYFESLLKKFGG